MRDISSKEEEMSKNKARIFNRDFKLKVIHRMESGENVSALARELSIRRKLLYEWRDAFRVGGPDALRAPGRPRKGTKVVGAKKNNGFPSSSVSLSGPETELSKAKRRIAELERKVGQQALEADFFMEALQHFEEPRQSKNRLGVNASTLLSKRGRSGKAD